MYGQILGVIAPLLLIAGIGFALEKGKAGLHGDTLSTLTMMVGTPALVFSALTSTTIPDSSLLLMASGSLLVIGTGAVISAVILRQMGLALRTFLPSLTVPNSGNTGLPIVLLAFGPDGLAIGVAFYFMTAIIQYTVIPIFTIGNFSIGRIAREPLIFRASGSSTQRAVDRMFSRAGLDPQPFLTLDARDGLYEAVVNGLGIGFLWRESTSRTDGVARLAIAEMRGPRQT